MPYKNFVSKFLRVPHPEHIPKPILALGRFLFPRSWRAKLATMLQFFAESQNRLSPTYRARQRQFALLKDTHVGETCVIIGNGPSMRNFDLAQLNGVTTFCLNRGYLLWQKQNMTPNFVVVSNPLVLEQFGSEIAGIPVPKFIPWACRDMLSDEIQHFYFSTLWRERFHKDASKGIWVGGTVTFAAMQIAYHMGFKKVVLIGVDHRFTFDGKPHEELVSQSADPNHFDPQYFGKNVRWHAPDLEMSERSFNLARIEFEARDREIVDATENGALSVFKKMDLAEVLKT